MILGIEKSSVQTKCFLQRNHSPDMRSRSNRTKRDFRSLTFSFQSGTCTLREAVIIGSILAKNSVPMLHSAAALLKIAEMNYSGANSIFIRVLIEKRYALPFRVVDALVHHFIR